MRFPRGFPPLSLLLPHEGGKPGRLPFPFLCQGAKEGAKEGGSHDPPLSFFVRPRKRKGRTTLPFSSGTHGREAREASLPLLPLSGHGRGRAARPSSFLLLHAREGWNRGFLHREPCSLLLDRKEAVGPSFRSVLFSGGSQRLPLPSFPPSSTTAHRREAREALPPLSLFCTPRD